MKLNTLRIKNFRQFRGEQHIDFCPTDNTAGKSVTIVYGQNGRGKTGLYRALMFALYGEQKLQQDWNSSENVALVNVHEIEDNEDKPVECFVEVSFNHDNKNYILKRTLCAIKSSARTIIEPRGVSLFVTGTDNNTTTVSDPDEISKVIDGILDQRVREYFLFDGEKIEMLTRASRDQRREVSKGLRNLLNIDSLELALRAVGKLHKKVEKDLQQHTSSEHRVVLHDLEKTRERIDNIKAEIDEVTTEFDRGTSEKEFVDKELNKLEGIKDLLRERNELEKAEQERTEELQNCLSEMKTKSGRVAIYIVRDTIEKVYEHIDSKRKKGEIPPEIRSDLIDRILGSGECICGRKVVSGDDAFKKILDWKHRTGDVALHDCALEIWKQLSSIKNYGVDVTEAAEALLQKYATVRNELERISLKLDEISGKLGSGTRDDAQKLEQHRDNIINKLGVLNEKADRLNEEMGLLEEKRQKLDAQRKEIEKKEGLKSELVKRANLIGDTEEALSQIDAAFTSEIKDRISSIATSHLMNLLDNDSKCNLKELKVSEDYSLQIFDRWNKPFLVNISAGQRQIMSISFILALAQVAGGCKFMEMPLFMDTPFGRLSFDHRKNLINNVPNICTQWILLATDTEFRAQEAKLFEESKKWGKFYQLKALPDGSTEIVERKLEDAANYLLDGKGA